MAFLLPPYLSLTMAIGALGFALVGRARPAWHATHAATLASGLITGESLVGLGNAILFIAAHKIHVDAGLHCRPKLVE